MPTASSIAWMVPSSPPVPCRAMKTTSTSPKAWEPSFSTAWTASPSGTSAVDGGSLPMLRLASSSTKRPPAVSTAVTTCPRRSSAAPTARPDTSETSRSAEFPPSNTMMRIAPSPSSSRPPHACTLTARSEPRWARPDYTMIRQRTSSTERGLQPLPHSIGPQRVVEERQLGPVGAPGERRAHRAEEILAPQPQLLPALLQEFLEPLAVERGGAQPCLREPVHQGGEQATCPGSAQRRLGLGCARRGAENLLHLGRQPPERREIGLEAGDPGAGSLRLEVEPRLLEPRRRQRRQLRVGTLPHVPRRHPLELHRVEHRGRARQALEAEVPHQLRRRQEFLAARRRPAKEGEEVQQCLGQVALGAVLVHVGAAAAVTLAELAPVGVENEGQMDELRQRQAQGVVQQALPRRVVEMI